MQQKVPERTIRGCTIRQSFAEREKIFLSKVGEYSRGGN